MQLQYKELIIMHYLFFCGVVFFFLIAPLIAIVPISFSVSPFMLFTEGMLAWPPEPEAWSLSWYKNMLGMCDADVVSSTVPCANKWMIGTVNSLYIGLYLLLLLHLTWNYGCTWLK